MKTIDESGPGKTTKNFGLEILRCLSGINDEIKVSIG